MDCFEENLIRLVREKEFLYNSKSRTYKNVLKRDEAWARIGAALNTSAQRCKQRWKSLRDRYVREKKIMEDPSSKAAESDFEVWELYGSLDFLNDSLQPKRKSGSHDDAPSPVTEEMCDVPKDILFEEFLIHEIPPTPGNESPAKKPRTKEYPKEFQAAEFFGNLSKTLSERFNTTEPDENDLFMKMIAKKMKVLPDRSKLRLQARIFQMVNTEVLDFLNKS